MQRKVHNTKTVITSTLTHFNYELLLLFQITNTDGSSQDEDDENEKGTHTHSYSILPRSTVPYDVRSDLSLSPLSQQERTTFVVSSELSV